jgi:5-methylcytosine-specific restriction endonuclease McrA
VENYLTGFFLKLTYIVKNTKTTFTAKHRTPIPDDLAAEVLFVADRTCCVCQERGKAIQIHHIDENPSNNTFENLAVLCPQCHNDTQLVGICGCVA